MESSSSSSSSGRKKEAVKKAEILKKKAESKKTDLKNISVKRKTTPDLKPTKVSSSSSSSDEHNKTGDSKKSKVPTDSSDSSDTKNFVEKKIVFVPEPASEAAWIKLDPKPNQTSVQKTPVSAQKTPQSKKQFKDISSSSSESSSEKRQRKKNEKVAIVGEKLVFVKSDYTVKSDDTFVVIDSVKPVKIKLFPISNNPKIPYNLSKKIVIKALHGLLSHTIECNQNNTFDKDISRKVLTLVGRDTCRLQTAGNTWIVV